MVLQETSLLLPNFGIHVTEVAPQTPFHGNFFFPSSDNPLLYTDQTFFLKAFTLPPHFSFNFVEELEYLFSETDAFITNKKHDYALVFYIVGLPTEDQLSRMIDLITDVNLLNNEIDQFRLYYKFIENELLCLIVRMSWKHSIEIMTLLNLYQKLYGKFGYALWIVNLKSQGKTYEEVEDMIAFQKFLSEKYSMVQDLKQQEFLDQFIADHISQYYFDSYFADQYQKENFVNRNERFPVFNIKNCMNSLQESFFSSFEYKWRHWLYYSAIKKNNK
jgi:hypothetical protein